MAPSVAHRLRDRLVATLGAVTGSFVMTAAPALGVVGPTVLPVSALAAATAHKCIDTRGAVTYTDLHCPVLPGGEATAVMLEENTLPSPAHRSRVEHPARQRAAPEHPASPHSAFEAGGPTGPQSLGGVGDACRARLRDVEIAESSVARDTAEIRRRRQAARASCAGRDVADPTSAFARDAQSSARGAAAEARPRSRVPARQARGATERDGIDAPTIFEQPLQPARRKRLDSD